VSPEEESIRNLSFASKPLPEVATERHRIWLMRDTGAPSYEIQCAVFLMLNPSLASRSKNDPTMRKLVGFNRRLSIRWFGVVNLFTKRTPYPAELFKEGFEDAVGELGDLVLHKMFQWAHALNVPVVAAWGGNGFAGVQHQWMDVRAEAIRVMAKKYAVPLKCLGYAKDGSPRHPLMLSYNDCRLLNYVVSENQSSSATG